MIKFHLMIITDCIKTRAAESGSISVDSATESDFNSNLQKRPDSDSIQTCSLRLETAILADSRLDFAM